MMDNQQNIPIDIHTNKLLDWLISRRHCKRDWQQSILVIREKINNAIQDMPATEEITQLLIGSYINYFHCTQIVELLKETEASTKNIFGQYSSKRMKDWQEIVRLYEKDNVYLAEAAQMLIRNVNYEVPSLKRQIAKCQQLQEEYTKKEIDYGKNSQEIKEQFHSMCKEIGIEGNDIEKEFISLLDELPEIFSKIAEKVKILKSSREFYLSFLQFTLNRNDLTNICLPILNHIIEKGNTTVYEWRTGEPPEIIEETKMDVASQGDNHNEQDDQIDFGDNGNSIDFGDDSSSSPNGDYVHVDKVDFGDYDNVQIDFGDDGNNHNKWEIMDTSKISIESSQGEGGKVARGSDALSVLRNQTTRNLFLNELLELEGFLRQRIVEMSDSNDFVLANQLNAAPPSIQLQTINDIQQMLTNVESIITELSTVKMQHLYLISNSSKYIERLTNSAKQMLSRVDKALDSQSNAALKRKELLDEENELKPKLELIIKKTKVLQKQTENEISKSYKNRPVNIMGGVNVM